MRTVANGEYLHPLASGMEEIGARIAHARLRAGLSQQDLADKIGVRAQTISRWETGRSPVRRHQLERIAEITGRSVGFFIQGGGVETPAAALETALEQLAAIQEQLDRLRGLVEGLLPGDPVTSGEQAGRGPGPEDHQV